MDTNRYESEDYRVSSVFGRVSGCQRPMPSLYINYYLCHCNQPVAFQCTRCLCRTALRSSACISLPVGRFASEPLPPFSSPDDSSQLNTAQPSSVRPFSLSFLWSNVYRIVVCIARVNSGYTAREKRERRGGFRWKRVFENQHRSLPKLS